MSSLPCHDENTGILYFGFSVIWIPPQYSALALSRVVGSLSLMMTLRWWFLSFQKSPSELCVYSLLPKSFCANLFGWYFRLWYWSWVAICYRFYQDPTILWLLCVTFTSILILICLFLFYVIIVVFCVQRFPNLWPGLR